MCVVCVCVCVLCVCVCVLCVCVYCVCMCVCIVCVCVALASFPGLRQDLSHSRGAVDSPDFAPWPSVGGGLGMRLVVTGSHWAYELVEASGNW